MAVDTDPHATKARLDDPHFNPEYDANEDGEIDTDQTEADTNNDGIIEQTEVEDAAVEDLAFDPATQVELNTHAGTAEAHHNQVDDETGTSAVASATQTDVTVSFGQSYVTGVGTAGFDAAISPVSDADAAIRSYTTDANGDIDGMTIRVHNTTAASETMRWRFAGRPA